jgi:glycine hydroxymethyltransferase
VTSAVFPVWAATHQVNRVAALALATAEAIAFGEEFMAQTVKNARALAASLDERGIPMLGRHKNFTTTHQAIADVRKHGRGLACAQALERANIIVNKNLIPSDAATDWNYPGGLRIGTIEVTRYGMKEPEMAAIGEMIARVVVRRESPESVRPDAVALRAGFRRLYYCFENGLPA